jgi:hypothetical protein
VTDDPGVQLVAAILGALVVLVIVPHIAWEVIKRRTGGKGR